MVHFSETQDLRSSRQFLAFSDAYLTSASTLCRSLAENPSHSTYPKGAVVMSLTFHGVELFLKAAILEKNPDELFSGVGGHDLDHLGKRYANLYPGKKFAFEIPFRNEMVEIVNPDPRIVGELEALIAQQKLTTPTDQLHRYPRSTTGEPWAGLYAFEASSFDIVITKVQRDIANLQGLIFPGQSNK